MTTEQVPLAERIAVVRRTIGNSEIAAKHYPDDMGYRKDVVILRAVIASLSDLADANERIRQLDAENQGFMREVAALREQHERAMAALRIHGNRYGKTARAALTEAERILAALDDAASAAGA